MKPPAFEYIAATSLEHALLLLDEHGDEAKVMAGGQSLMPMMNFRLVQPSLIVDISRIPGLDSIEEIGDALHIGALTRHVHLMTAPLVIEHFPIISEAMRHVAHTAIRNRGTIGGSLSHADPAAELPMIAMLLDAKMLIVNKDGRRTVDARDFFVGPLTTVLSGTEFLVAIEFPFLPARTEWAFEEVARRSGDFALAAVGVALEIRDEVVSNVRIAVTGVGEIPLRLQGVEQSLIKGRLQELDDLALARIGREISEAVEPSSDLQASADYRQHLLGVLGSRAIKAAWDRAKEAAR